MRGDPELMEPTDKFSDELEQWLRGAEVKSLGALGAIFADKSFAVAIALLMLVSAVPVPTGGIVFVFQIIATLVAAQMVLGRRSIWLPARWRERPIGNIAESKALPFILRRIRSLEKYSRPRWAGVFDNRMFIRFVGAILMVLAIAAALSPPLSGLETLPAIGAVMIALAIILRDFALFVVGVLIGIAGVVLFISVGAAFDPARPPPALTLREAGRIVAVWPTGTGRNLIRAHPISPVTALGPNSGRAATGSRVQARRLTGKREASHRRPALQWLRNSSRYLASVCPKRGKGVSCRPATR